MTTGSIEFACPYCDRVTRVPAAYGGKQGKCPGCQKVIEVPAVDGAAASKPTEVVGSPVVDAPAAEAPRPDWQKQHLDRRPGDDDPGPQRPCPFCGEQIKAQAKKCKFCGEFLDERARAQNRSAGQLVGRLASPVSRFAARLVDGLIEGVPFGLLFFAGVAIADRGGGNNPGAGIALMGLGGLYLLGMTIYQWYLIASSGKTIGKRLLGVKIVKNDGTDVDFVSGVILRNWCNFAIGMIPYVGGCIQIIGYLLIFAEDRKCLHDHIASTVVIEG